MPYNRFAPHSYAYFMKNDLLVKFPVPQGCQQHISNESAPPSQLVFLDITRALSALIVLLVHLLQVFAFRFFGMQHAASHFFGTLGRHAVIVFFVLSGYLVCRSMLANTARFGRFNMLDYAASRVARIYPPFLVAFLLSVLVWLFISLTGLPGSPSSPFVQHGYGVLAPQVITLAAHEILPALMLVGGLDAANPPLWSLYVEAQLYLLAGLLAWALSRRAFPMVAFAVVLLGWFSYASPEFLMFCMLWSVAAIFAIVEWRLGHIPRRWLIAAALAGIGLLLLLAILNGATALSQLDSMALHRYWSQLGFGLVYAGLLLHCRHAGVASSARLAGWSRWSYSLYVTHVPVIFLMVSLSQPYVGMSLWAATLAGGATCLATLWVARLSGKLAERPAVFKNYLLCGVGGLRRFMSKRISRQTGEAPEFRAGR